jgi:hypothetical protein
MRIDAEAQDSQSLFEIVLPDRDVPLPRPTLEHLGPPDVIHEDVDVSVRSMNVVGKALHFRGIEMIDHLGNAGAAKARDLFRRLLDRFRPVVVRARRARSACAAPGTDDSCPRLAQRRRNSAPGGARRARDHGHTVAKCVEVG